MLHALLRLSRFRQTGVFLTGALIALLSADQASAQRVLYDDPPPVRFFIGGGVTYGGDKLASANFADGSSQNIRAGNLAQFYGGLEWRINRDIQTAVSFGYQVDSADTYYGSLRFSRYPLEMLAYYRIHPYWRIGGGLRVVFSPDLSGSGNASFLRESFDTAYSPVIELEYLASRYHGIKFRAVRERYRSTENLPEARGDHIGLLLAFYF